MSECFMAPGGDAAISVLWTAALVGKESTEAEAERVSSGDGVTDVTKGCLRALWVPGRGDRVFSPAWPISPSPISTWRGSILQLHLLGFLQHCLFTASLLLCLLLMK